MIHRKVIGSLTRNQLCGSIHPRDDVVQLTPPVQELKTYYVSEEAWEKSCREMAKGLAPKMASARKFSHKNQSLYLGTIRFHNLDVGRHVLAEVGVITTDADTVTVQYKEGSRVYEVSVQIEVHTLVVENPVEEPCFRWDGSKLYVTQGPFCPKDMLLTIDPGLTMTMKASNACIDYPLTWGSTRPGSEHDDNPTSGR